MNENRYSESLNILGGTDTSIEEKTKNFDGLSRDDKIVLALIFALNKAKESLHNIDNSNSAPIDPELKPFTTYLKEMIDFLSNEMCLDGLSLY